MSPAPTAAKSCPQNGAHPYDLVVAICSAQPKPMGTDTIDGSDIFNALPMAVPENQRPAAST